MQAWILKRLISIFGRAARRGHYPRERAMQKIFAAADIPLPHRSLGFMYVCVCVCICLDGISLVQGP